MSLLDFTWILTKLLFIGSLVLIAAYWSFSIIKGISRFLWNVCFQHTLWNWSRLRRVSNSKITRWSIFIFPLFIQVVSFLGTQTIGLSVIAYTLGMSIMIVSYLLLLLMPHEISKYSDEVDFLKDNKDALYKEHIDRMHSDMSNSGYLVSDKNNTVELLRKYYNFLDKTKPFVRWITTNLLISGFLLIYLPTLIRLVSLIRRLLGGEDAPEAEAWD